MADLLPCPICGHPEKEQFSSVPGPSLMDIGGWEINCSCGLGLCVGNDPTREGVIARWNTRAAPPASASPDDARDAARYRWLRERINWKDERVFPATRPAYHGWRQWSHYDTRANPPASDHIDEYIDSQLRAAPPPVEPKCQHESGRCESAERCRYEGRCVDAPIQRRSVQTGVKP